MRRLLLALLPALWGCSSEPVAGGTSSTGNSLTVHVVRPDGTMATGDSIILRPDTLFPAPDDVRTAIADAQGGALFEDIGKGPWVVEARGDSTGTIWRVEFADGETPDLMLHAAPYATLSGSLLMTDSGSPGRAYLQGTGQSVPTDDSGRFRFERASPGHHVVVALPRTDGSLGRATWSQARPLPGDSLKLDALHPIKTLTDEWQLAWSEDFDSLQADIWNIDTGNGCPDLCAWGNGSLQSFDSAHVLLQDGILTLRAENTRSGWRSGSIQTRGRVEFLYGRIEIQARFPATKGAWSLLSLQGDSTPGPVWPSGGAIDIAGLWGHEPGKMMGIAHRMGPDSVGTHPGANLVWSPGWADRWVEVAVEWSPTEIVWMADDQVFHRVAGGPPFDHPFYLALRLGVGGDGNAVPDSAQTPFEASIGAVRVYRRTR